MDEEENLNLGEMPEGTVLNNTDGSLYNLPFGGAYPTTSASNADNDFGLSPVTGTGSDADLARMTRQQYIDFRRNYGDFEADLIERARTDTSLIDQAREDSPIASQLAEGIAARNRQRYGTTLTPAQMRAMQGSSQRAGVLGGIQAVEDAKLAQSEANQKLMSDLINIGQGVNRSSINSLTSVAQNASARRQAYEQAKAQSRAQTMSTVGSLASTAILVAAGL